MGIADDGSAIICGELIRKGGVRVLRVLAKQSEPISVPQLGDLLEGKSSDSDLYTVLRRLVLKPGLLIRTEKNIAVLGTNCLRVNWEVTQAVKDFFLEHEPPN